MPTSPSEPILGLRRDIEAKIARGFEHLDELVTGASTFSASGPVRIILDPADARGFHLARLRVVATPPPILGLIAGEAMHQFLSSLDHLMTELVWLDNPGVPDTPTFPLFEDEKKYRKYVRRKGLASLLKPLHLGMIESIQPWRDLALRPTMRGGYLNRMRQFDNLDKHQAVHAGSITFAGGLQSVWPHPNVPSIDSFDWRVTAGPPPIFLEDGWPFFRVRMKAGLAPPPFRLDPPPTVAFGDAHELWRIETMRRFGENVQGLIASFHS